MVTDLLPRFRQIVDVKGTVHIITRKRLREFSAKHPNAKKPLDVWYHMVRRKRYTTSSEVKADFPTASFLGDTKTVFNIGGNKFRLVTHFRYDLGKVFIRWVLTHREYDEKTADGTL